MSNYYMENKNSLLLTTKIKILKEIFNTSFVSSNNITDLAYACSNDMNDLLIELYKCENTKINERKVKDENIFKKIFNTVFSVFGN